MPVAPPSLLKKRRARMHQNFTPITAGDAARADALAVAFCSIGAGTGYAHAATTPIASWPP